MTNKPDAASFPARVASGEAALARLLELSWRFAMGKLDGKRHPRWCNRHRPTPGPRAKGAMVAIVDIGGCDGRHGSQCQCRRAACLSFLTDVSNEVAVKRTVSEILGSTGRTTSWSTMPRSIRPLLRSHFLTSKSRSGTRSWQ
jgi:hypothetical protein